MIAAPNYTQLPNVILDKWIAELTGAEFKVLCYICRRTFGHHKRADAISLRQLSEGITRKDGTVLDAGTGLNRDTVIEAVKKLLTLRLITAEKRGVPGAGRDINIYGINLSESTNEAAQSDYDESEFPTGVVGITDQGWSEHPTRVVGKTPGGVVGISDPQKKASTKQSFQKKVDKNQHLPHESEFHSNGTTSSTSRDAALRSACEDPKANFNLEPFEPPPPPSAKIPKQQRTTDEIKKDLGSRLPWWEAFWQVYPCRNGMREALDAFERRVHDKALAETIWRAAKNYAAWCAKHPDRTVKYAQGWINGERWLDELANPEVPKAPSWEYVRPTKPPEDGYAS